MALDDFCEYFEIETESESTSLSGWIMEQMEEIPEGGETLNYENLTITVGEVDNHRITDVKVVCAPKEDETDKDDERKKDKKNDKDE